MAKTIRWGILGPGAIAHRFAQGLRFVDDAELHAVGSRAQERADAFGDEYGVPRRHGSYEELAHDPEVDAIYVATPHTLHKENTLLCLDAGKAVLCEKPFAVNAGEAEAMIARARQKKLFLMEAMWTRFLPAHVQVRKWLSENKIGDVRMLIVDFGFRAEIKPEGRLFNLKLAGGALLDIGVYTIALAYMVFGRPPVHIETMAHIGETGVDEHGAMTFGYDKGEVASLCCAVRTSTPQTAVILGTEGWIRLPEFWHASSAEVRTGRDKPQPVELMYQGTGYNYEAIEVGACLRQGTKESAVMPLGQSLDIMQTMDAIRAKWGLKYPCEE